MNEKINFQDLSALLAEKAAIPKKEAETFLREYFEVMNEELIKSGSLKIKDLGAFKLSSVEDRESIDVTTGERVLIPAHYKVAFSPDKKLAETVNEPFAFFETIELEEGFQPEELKLRPEEEASKEPELTSEEEEEIILEEEPIIEEEEEIVSEEEPISEEEEELVFEEEKPVPDDEPIPDEQTYENEKSYPDKKSIIIKKNIDSDWRDCDYHHDRKRYYKNKKKIRRLRIIIGILSVLLLAALGYIAYLKQFEKLIPFEKFIPLKKSVPAVVLKESVSEKDTVPVVSEVFRDSIVPPPVEATKKVEPVKKEPTERTTTPGKSGESKQITVVAGQRLTSIALKEYGDKAFWIYIYLENRDVLSDPGILPVGIKISIPPAEKYRIDCNNPASVQKAKEMAAKYL
ncbi:MAG: HU family DNA-binding protein [Candidatus Azobacteroides sp.]|nr:HU family DNA-binding protein [Candidatus Azobacteroides sp.]